MWGVAAAVSGATSSPSVTEPMRDADGARNSTRRESIDAQLRGVVSGRATGAGTPWPSVPTAGAPTLRRPRLVRRRRRPAVRLRGGGPPPPDGDSGAKARGQEIRLLRPMETRMARRRWRRFGTSPTRGRRWRSRARTVGRVGYVGGPRALPYPALSLVFFWGVGTFPFCWCDGGPTMTG